MSKFAKAKTALRRDFYTNRDLEQSGTWMNVAYDEDTKTLTRFRVRSITADGPKAVRRQQTAEWQAKYWGKKLDVPEDEMQAANVEYAIALVSEWENVLGVDEADPDGDPAPQPLTPENARDLFTAFPALVGDVLKYADKRSNYGEAAERDMAKNSGGTSARD